MKFGMRIATAGMLAALALVLHLTTPASLVAQEQPPLITVTVVKVKLEKIPEFERLVKDELIPGMKKAAVPWMTSWQADALGPAGTYFFVGEIPNFAVYDSPHPMAKALGDAKMAALIASLRACSLSVERHQLDTDMSVSTMPEGSPGLAVYVGANPVPGQGAALRKFLVEEVAPAMKKAGTKGFLVHRERFGSGPRMHLVVFMDKYMDLDKGHPFIRAYGPEKGMAMIEKSDTLMSVQSLYPIRMMPELSYGDEK